MSYHNIPAELQSLQQWVISNSVEDKLPRNPRTGRVASVTDPSTWGTYQEAIQSGAKQIGFVLTPWDPYTIIDLDNKPEKPSATRSFADGSRLLHGCAGGVSVHSAAAAAMRRFLPCGFFTGWGGRLRTEFPRRNQVLIRLGVMPVSITISGGFLIGCGRVVP